MAFGSGLSAKALGELPRVDAAFAAGELSYCKVRALTRVGSADNEELLLTMAKGATGAQVEQVCRGFRCVQRRPPRGAEIRAGDTWRNIRAQLEAIKVVEYERAGVCVHQTTELRPEVAELLAKLRVKAPPKLHSVTRGADNT